MLPLIIAILIGIFLVLSLGRKWFWIILGVAVVGFTLLGKFAS